MDPNPNKFAPPHYFSFSPRNQPSSNAYPTLNLSSILNKNPTSNQVRNEHQFKLGLSISSIKKQEKKKQKYSSDDECSNVSVVSNVSKFFRSFKKNVEALNESNDSSFCQQILRELSKDVKKQQSMAQKSEIYPKIQTSETNVRPNKTQKFMQSFNRSKLPKQQDKDKNKQKVIQKSQKSSGQNQELSNTIKQEQKQYQLKNQGKVQINSQKNLLNISQSYISDNLQSNLEEPIFPQDNVSELRTQNNNVPKFQKQKELRSGDQESSSDGVQDESSQQQGQQEEIRKSADHKQVDAQIKQPMTNAHIAINADKNQGQEQKKQERLQDIKQADNRANDDWVSQSSQEQQSEDLDVIKQQNVEAQQEQKQQQEQLTQQERHHLGSIIVGIHVYKKLTPEQISQLTEQTKTYHLSSKRYPAIPRKKLLGTLRALIQQIEDLSNFTSAQYTKKYNSEKQGLQNQWTISQDNFQNVYKVELKLLGNQVRQYLRKDNFMTQILKVIAQFFNNDYFNVGPRRQAFSWVLHLISLVQKSRKKISERSSNQPHSTRNRLENASQNLIPEQQSDQEQENFSQQQDQLNQAKIIQNDHGLEVQQDFFESDQDDKEEQQTGSFGNLIESLLVPQRSEAPVVQAPVLQSFCTQNQEQIKPKYSPENIKSYQVGSYLKKNLPPLIQSLSNTLIKYNSSDYFHVGPRYQLLSFIQQIVNCVLKNNPGEIDPKVGEAEVRSAIKMGEEVRKYVSAERSQSILNTCKTYYNSKYFHVNPRRSIFMDVRKLISIYQTS